MNEHLLQVKLTPTEYQAVTRDKSLPLNADEYWQHIPHYTVGRCPLCGEPYTAQLDTYSLRYWGGTSTQGLGVFYEYSFRRGDERMPAFVQYHGQKHIIQELCPHFVAVQCFVNLRGVKPTEVPRLYLGCEVPYVHPVFLPDDIRSYAVMHSLPICRIESDQFVPRYSLYMTTYYSEAPPELVRRRWKIAPETHAAELLLGSGYYFYKEKEAWDLPQWVRAGKLMWLDTAEPQLPLRAGPVEAFPYTNIQGRWEERNVYRDGKWEDQSFLGRLKRFIPGR